MLLLTRKSVHIAIITVFGLAIYAHTLHAPFYWDDTNFLESSLVKNLAYFIDLDAAKGFREYGGFISRYVGYLTFALNYRINGLDVAGYHVVNIAIHLLAATLVYRLIQLTFKTPYAGDRTVGGTTDARSGFVALLAALLFVAHPLQTEAVTYIVQRFASLATMLYLLSLTSYIKARLILNEPKARFFSAAGWFAVALASALMAMKTKEIAYTLPLMAILYEFLFFPKNIKKQALVFAVGGFLTFGAIFVVKLSYGSFAELIRNMDQATRLQTHMPRWDYLATQFRVIATYLRLMLFPVGQRLDYDYPLYTSFFNPEVLLSGALLCAMFGIAVYSLCRSRRGDENKSVLLRVIAFGIFWFFLSLVIESSIIPIVDVIFEHRMYLPSAGLFTALAAFLSLAAGADAWIPGWPQKRIVAGIAFVLLLLAGTTFARNLLWCDEVAFWEDNAVKSPGKARVFTNLGLVLEKKGNFDGAIAAYRRAVELDPKRTDALLDLGLIYTQKGWLDDALAQFKAALKIIPGQFEAYNDIGRVYGIRFQLDEALTAFQQALNINPTRPEPYDNIGRIYFMQGRYDEGLQKVKECLALDPRYEPAYINRGTALLSQGRYGEARADFQRALKISPSDENAAALVRQIDSMR